MSVGRWFTSPHRPPQAAGPSPAHAAPLRGRRSTGLPESPILPRQRVPTGMDDDPELPVGPLRDVSLGPALPVSPRYDNTSFCSRGRSHGRGDPGGGSGRRWSKEVHPTPPPDHFQPAPEQVDAAHSQAGRFAEPEPGVGQQPDEQLVRRRAFLGQLGDLRVGQEPLTASFGRLTPSATLQTSRPSRTASAGHCPMMSTACRVIESPTTVPSSATQATTSACVIAFSGSPSADTRLVLYPPAGESGSVRPRSSPPRRGALAAWRMSLRSGMLGSCASASPFAESASSLA